VPILNWLPHYNKAWLTGDIVAGLSVWALMVPQSLGYAAISGVPVQYGLYAAAIALIVYAIFGSSRHVVTGPTSTIAAVTGAAVLSVAKGGSSEAIALVAVITMLAGILYIILSVLKMGWVSNFLAESVLVGFIFGIGIDVAVGQLKHVTGTHVTGESVWQKLAIWITSLPQIHTTTLVVGVAALVLLFVLKIYAPKVPCALVALVLGIGASATFDLSAQGVAVVGKVPRGLPIPVLPDISLITQNFGLILSGAIGVLLVGFSESLAAARQYASKHHYDIDINQEMLAQGLANGQLHLGPLSVHQRLRQSVQEFCQRWIWGQIRDGLPGAGSFCHPDSANSGTVVCCTARGRAGGHRHRGGCFRADGC